MTTNLFLNRALACMQFVTHKDFAKHYGQGCVQLRQSAALQASGAELVLHKTDPKRCTGRFGQPVRERAAGEDRLDAALAAHGSLVHHATEKLAARRAFRFAARLRMGLD